MKVGDLIRYVRRWYPVSYTSGLVIELGVKTATIMWPDGNVTSPSVHKIEVISEAS